MTPSEYCSGLPFPSPGDLPNPGIDPRSSALQGNSLPTEPEGCPRIMAWEWRSLLLLQQMFLTWESNQSLLHCRRIVYQLSYQGSPTIQVWPKSNPLHLDSGSGKQIQGSRSVSVLEELWTEFRDIVQEVIMKTITKKKKCNKAKELSDEALQIAEKKEK